MGTRAELQAETVELLSQLIRADTSNPPGNETRGAQVIAAYLERHGIASELVGPDHARLNLIARLPGTGGGHSLTLLGHTDVVPADRSEWTRDPFGGEVHDGHVWGRGAIDMKSHTASNAVAFCELVRSGFRPHGDLLLIAEADEEQGELGVGLPWLVRERPDIRTDYCITEGGGERLALADGRVVYTFTASEKLTMPICLRLRGRAGHASAPSPESGIYALVPVLERLRHFQTELRASAELTALLDVVAPGPGSDDERVVRARASHRYLDEIVPALRGSTIAPTGVVASHALNVMPGIVELLCDCRVLPGTTFGDLVAEFRLALGDLDVEIEALAPADGGSSSSLDTPLYAILARLIDELEPGAQVAPLMMRGFTNSHYLREAFGTVCYGFYPFKHTDLALMETMHSADERIDVEDLGDGVTLLLGAARAIGELA